MSTSPSLLTDVQPAAENISEKSHGGGPNTEAGKAVSSQNAITYGLFAIRDFIRPDEREVYDEFAQSLQSELAPDGMLELNLADEIRRAMWRLRRCGQIEENFSGLATDPMEEQSAASLQRSVDRARSQAHRLLHKCTAELRKLQTERQYRNEYFDEGSDVSKLGLCDLHTVQKKIDKQQASEHRSQKPAFERGHAAIEALLEPGLFCTDENAELSEAA